MVPNNPVENNIGRPFPYNVAVLPEESLIDGLKNDKIIPL